MSLTIWFLQMTAHGKGLYVFWAKTWNHYRIWLRQFRVWSNLNDCAGSRNGLNVIQAARKKKPATLPALPGLSTDGDQRRMWKMMGISGSPSTSTKDTKPVERVEVATLKLGAQCGLRVAEAKLELRDSDSPIALIRRFDRRGNTRIPYISARTALDWKGDERGYYTDIAYVIRQISSKPVDDLNELWRRIVFTILVGHRDNNLTNYGFIYVGGDRWRLSPAFDINPLQSRRVLRTGIIRGGSFDASLEIALEAAEFFDLTPDDARQRIMDGKNDCKQLEASSARRRSITRRG